MGTKTEPKSWLAQPTVWPPVHEFEVSLLSPPRGVDSKDAIARVFKEDVVDALWVAGELIDIVPRSEDERNFTTRVLSDVRELVAAAGHALETGKWPKFSDHRVSEDSVGSLAKASFAFLNRAEDPGYGEPHTLAYWLLDAIKAERRQREQSAAKAEPANGAT